jgi:CHAT domain-containing protein
MDTCVIAGRACRWLPAVVLLISVALWPGPVWGQDKALTPAERKQLEAEARQLDQEARARFQERKYDDAIRAWEKSLALREKLYPGQDHPTVAASLSSLGAVLHAVSRAAESLPYHERALAMQERLHAKQDHPDVLLCLHNLGVVLRSLGQAGKALPHAERDLAMCARLYPKQDHPRTTQSLLNLGHSLRMLGRPKEALPHFERALAMRERLYPDRDHPDVAVSLNSLGIVLDALGRPGAALPHFRRALAMRERLYPGKDHPDVATSLNSLGLVLHSLGQPRAALPHSERALAMRERFYAKQDHPELANSLNNLAVVLDALNQPGKALPYAERALAMRERLFAGGDHPDVADSLHNLASILSEQGQQARAVPFYKRAVALYDRLQGNRDHPRLAHCLNSLASVLGELGRPAQALPFAERALAMRERLFPNQDHPDLAYSLNSTAVLLDVSGQTAQALPFAERALAMRERLYPGRDHLELARSLNNVGLMLNHLGRPAEALPFAERGLAVRHQLQRQNFLDEAQGLAAATRLPLIRDLYLSASQAGAEPDRVYGQLWHHKAAVTRALQDRRAAVRLALADPKQHQQLRADLDELSLLRGQRSRWLLHPGPDLAERDRQVRQLTEAIEQREHKLGKAFPEGPRRQALDKLGPADLIQRLPGQTAFIDLIRYTHLGKGGQRQLRYVAFVLAPGGAVRRVELEDAAPIDLAVDRWRQAVAGWSAALKPDAQRRLQDEADKQAAELRRLVWVPLAKHLPKEPQAVYVAADGNLARFAFAALPGGKPGTLLLEELAVAAVPHGPYLLEQLLYPPGKADAPGPALVLGDLDYGLADPRSYGPLKGTAAEVKQVTALAGKRPVVTLSGGQATGDRLRTALPGARYAHLATHGFFKEGDFAQEQQRLAEQLKRYEFLEVRATHLAWQGAQSPLAFVGLALAGANTPDRAGPDGGLLAGEAVVDLPLEGLRLAVLSACETGLGHQTGGEAVRNLQLAFHVAGCPDVVASLWQVDDQATAVLMGKFYYELWVKGRPPLEALRQAQLLVYLRPDLVAELSAARAGPPDVHARRRLEVLEQGVRAPAGKGAAGTLPPRTPTRLWAAFVLSGPGR